ncbi:MULTISPECIES: hypothetical protein [unclassified Aerococcus]|uniref:hypothetical protein n=1 Tax=unclassified Aerococcus TaxID=2618060 RepID=UPI0008A3711F|nr:MULTISPECIES: hypothetical protein [unclassified Aerococcus]MDK6679211.1 hypothetical protein [Aerococcus sp. UMB8608]MDK6685947.1 hypothetical protein [Aerococcus sp. UMB8623]MDK6940751.1 hypothetical protein [Aerococcus sp. UMB8487]OFK21275.1 hypothetical protein HMPREF2829_03790 [Aerococcus sp. HMSC072A12]OFR32569.1 hypothetical protein HMPREF2892_08125 [Aerococcus sp. HMSC061A03]
MNKKLILIKSLGKTTYKNYKDYLNTKTPEQIIDIEANLKTKYSKWSKLLTSCLVTLIASAIAFSGKLTYDFIKNSFKLAKYNEAMILVQGILPIFIIILIFFIVLLFVLYNNLANTKRKLIYLQRYEEELANKKSLEV